MCFNLDDTPIAPMRRRKKITDSEEELTRIVKPSILDSIPRPVPRIPPSFDTGINDKISNMKQEFANIHSDTRTFTKSLANISESSHKEPVVFKPVARAFEPYVPRQQSLTPQQLSQKGSNAGCDSHLTTLNITETLSRRSESPSVFYKYRSKTPLFDYRQNSDDTTIRRHFRSVSTPRSASPGFVSLADHCKYKKKYCLFLDLFLNKYQLTTIMLFCD